MSSSQPYMCQSTIGQIWMELRYFWCCTVQANTGGGLWSLQEYAPAGSDEEVVVLDIPASFSPYGFSRFFWKIIVFAIGFFSIFVTLGEAWMEEEENEMDKNSSKNASIGFMTMAGLVLSVIYLLLSLYNSLSRVRQPLPTILPSLEADQDAWILDSSDPRTQLTWRPMATWALFTIAAHTQGIVTVVYWFFVYPQVVEDEESMSVLEWMSIVLLHGVVGGLVWMDGLIVNRIPVRLTHWVVFILPWNVFCVLVGLMFFNSRGEDEYQEGDDWIGQALSDNDGQAAKPILLVLLVLSPFIHFLLWAISYGCFGGHWTRNLSQDDALLRAAKSYYLATTTAPSTNKRRKHSSSPKRKKRQQYDEHEDARNGIV